MISGPGPGKCAMVVEVVRRLLVLWDTFMAWDRALLMCFQWTATRCSQSWKLPLDVYRRYNGGVDAEYVMEPVFFDPPALEIILLHYI